MATLGEEVTLDRTLNDIFKEGHKSLQNLDKRNDATNSPEFQMEIKRCMKLFEDATRLVSAIGMFSSNERYEEIPTNHLKYLLLPYFLAQLTQKLCGGDRKEIVDASEVYYRDFLKRCSDYGLAEGVSLALARPSNGGDGSAGEIAMLMRMAEGRNAKVQKYRQKKELQDRINELKVAMEREELDEEQQKEFYVKMLKSCVMECEEDLASVATEKQMLEYGSKMGGKDDSKPPPRGPPLKPVIITRDAVQQAIYGAGYPSLPTMTVQDFYDQRVAEGIFPDPTKASAEPRQKSLQDKTEQDLAQEEEQEAAENDRLQDADDVDYLERARRMDEFKDEVRRGDGNRYNRS
ncbi:immunoglobulin-binding protein 1 [Phlebotomus argentipes]|uniref:immunoglobulin-binding protein 1 n=1 Tax=Phlebotomus argentipes TaxID=94469 RepID=UPI002892D9DE|nr:immunoglobulin-binding protein 1 [Phlebotomus argentipes]